MRTAAVAALAAVAVACSACTSGGGDPVVVDAVPTAHAAACERLAAKLPDDLGEDLSRRDTEPADPHVAAYGDPPIVVRCGAPLAGTYKLGDPLINVNEVAFHVHERGEVSVWSTPRAFVNVEITVPRKWTGDRVSYLTDAVKAAHGGL